MTHWSGTIATGSGSATATAFRDKIKSTITAHPNWTFVETASSGAGTNSMDVYKCSGIGNGLGIDFYVAVFQWTGSNPNQMALSIAEGYNPATHKPMRPAMFGQVNATIVMTPDGGIMPPTQEVDWWSGSYTNGYSWGTWASASYRPQLNAIEDCGVSVAADGVYIYIKAADGQYAGVYDSLVPNPSVNDPLPIIVHCFGGAWGNPNSGIGSSTRHPLIGGKTVVNCQPTIIGSGVPAGGAGGYNYSPCSSASRLSNNGTLAPFAIGATGNDTSDLYAGDGVTSGVYVDRYVFYNLYANGGSSGGRHNIGYARGLYKRLRWGSALSGTAFLDTVTIEGTEYLFLYNGVFVEKNPA